MSHLPCHRPCEKPCLGCPSMSLTDSLSMYEKARPQTIWPTGFVAQGTRFQQPRSSDTERALALLDEAYRIVMGMPMSTNRGNALDLMEESAMWIKDINV